MDDRVPRLAAALAITAFFFTLAFILIANLSKSGFWYDELWSLNAVSGSFSNMLQLLQNDFHPPGFHILLYGWVRLVGTTEAAARSLSILFFLATIPLTYFLGRALRLDRAAAVFGAGLFSFTSGTVWFGIEARATAMLVCLTTAALLCLLNSSRSRAAFWSAALLGIVALYSHYSALFILVPAAFLLAWQERDSRFLWVVLIWVAALLPWAIQINTQAHHFARLGWLKPPTWVSFQVDARRLVGGYEYAAYGFLLFYAVALAELLRQRAFTRNLWLLVPPVVAAGTAFVSHLIVPIFHERYLFTVVPFLGLGAGFLIQNLRPIPVRWVIAIVVPLSYAYLIYGVWEDFTIKGEDWRGAAEFVLSREADSTLYVTTDNSRFFRHYIPGIVVLPEQDQAAIDHWIQQTGNVKVWFLQARQYPGTPATRTVAEKSQILLMNNFTAARAMLLEVKP